LRRLAFRLSARLKGLDGFCEERFPSQAQSELSDVQPGRQARLEQRLIPQDLAVRRSYLAICTASWTSVDSHWRGIPSRIDFDPTIVGKGLTGGPFTAELGFP